MNESVISTVIEQMLVLPDDAQRQVLEFLQNLRASRGLPGKHLLKFAGRIEADDLKQMQHATESDCERVDSDEW